MKLKSTRHSGIDDGKSPTVFRAKKHDAATAKKTGWAGAYVAIRPSNVTKQVREVRRTK